MVVLRKLGVPERMISVSVFPSGDGVSVPFIVYNEAKHDY